MVEFDHELLNGENCDETTNSLRVCPAKVIDKIFMGETMEKFRRIAITVLMLTYDLFMILLQFYINFDNWTNSD